MDDFPNLPLIDAVDMEILMHRDTHFGSNFSVMLEYYKKEHVGTFPDYSVSRIRELKEIEDNTGKDLSELILPSEAKEEIKKYQTLYFELRKVYEKEDSNRLPRLIADLLFSEEETPQKEIKALALEGETSLEPLIHLISSELFSNPLSPGYGRGPYLAVLALAKIEDPKTIPPLFEALGRHDFFTDEAIIQALCLKKESVKAFLIQQLKKRPLSKDNEKAALILSNLPPDPSLPTLALNLLTQEDVFTHYALATYLIFLAATTEIPKERLQFSNLLKIKNIDPELAFEINLIVDNWNK
ncbi:MAG: hypothetical protein WDZ28_02005 [Simkaniaceae bacterium]